MATPEGPITIRLPRPPAQRPRDRDGLEPRDNPELVRAKANAPLNRNLNELDRSSAKE